MKLDRDIWYPDRDTHFFKGDGPKYQHTLLKLAVRMCRKRELALDVGAHVGLWSIRLATRFKQVVALEPMPENFRCLEMNCGHLVNVDMRRVAAGERCTESFVSPNSTGNTGDCHISLEGDQASMVTVDSLGLESVSLMKIDTQGYEPLVLYGAIETVARCRPVVVAEDVAGVSKKYGVAQSVFPDIMRSLGYRVAHRTAKDSVYVAR